MPWQLCRNIILVKIDQWKEESESESARIDSQKIKEIRIVRVLYSAPCVVALGLYFLTLLQQISESVSTSPLHQLHHGQILAGAPQIEWQ